MKFVAHLFLLICLTALHTTAGTLSTAARLQLALGADARLSRVPAARAEAVRQFYAGRGYQAVWTDTASCLPVAQSALTFLQRAPQFGLVAADYNVVGLQQLADSVQQRVRPAELAAQTMRLELGLSSALLQFAAHLRHGRLQPYTTQPLALAGAAATEAADAVRRALRAGAAGFAEALLTTQPQSRSYVRLLFAWQHLQRTDSLRAATLARRVGANLERLRWEPAADSLYLAANIASQTLQVVRGSAVLTTHRIVVGKPETPTPELASRVNYFQTAPEWRVPNSIATNEMLPRLRRNPGYLAANGLRLYSSSGQPLDARRINWRTVTPERFPYQIRQVPGEDNALGNIVFRFANAHDVYLHDTPARQLFARPERLLSHGCIRLQRPADLAAFLLRRDGGKTAAERVEQMQNSIENGDSKVFSLRYSLPILVRYLTCEADGAELRCLPDVYGRDEALMEALYGPANGLLSFNNAR